jgi:hypothetical protein
MMISHINGKHVPPCRWRRRVPVVMRAGSRAPHSWVVGVAVGIACMPVVHHGLLLVLTPTAANPVLLLLP